MWRLNSQLLVFKLLSCGLLGVYEVIIEDAVLFIPLGIVTISNPVYLIWIGCVELVGISQPVLLFSSRKFQQGQYKRALIMLWLLMTPGVFTLFTLGPYLARFLNYVPIWGGITATLFGALAIGLPAYLPKVKVFREKIPLGYVTLFIGMSIDIALSLIQPLADGQAAFAACTGDIFVSSLLIIVLSGATLISIGYFADRKRLTINNRTRRDIQRFSIPYVIAIIGLISGLLPSYAPLLVFLVTWGLHYICKFLKVTRFQASDSRLDRSKLYRVDLPRLTLTTSQLFKIC